MTVLRRLVVLAAVATLLGGCATAAADTPPPVGHAELQLVGTWVGELDGSGDGVLRMEVVTAASDGTSFDGELTFADERVESTEAVHALMTPHGHLVAGIGEDASIEAHITDPETLDYCLVRYGFDPLYSCGRLVRES